MHHTKCFPILLLGMMMQTSEGQLSPLLVAFLLCMFSISAFIMFFSSLTTTHQVHLCDWGLMKIQQKTHKCSGYKVICADIYGYHHGPFFSTPTSRSKFCFVKWDIFTIEDRLDSTFVSKCSPYWHLRWADFIFSSYVETGIYHFK